MTTVSRVNSCMRFLGTKGKEGVPIPSHSDSDTGRTGVKCLLERFENQLGDSSRHGKEKEFD